MTDLLHAYLLHARPYRETSLLLDVFTAEDGRCGAVMRAGRRARSQPQLFQPLLASLQGAGELRSVRVLEPAGPRLVLTGKALFSGFYLNELLSRLLPRDDVPPGLFVGYATTLGQLADGAPVEVLLRQFEATLLEALGYGIDYRHDADSGAPVCSGKHYGFHPERGLCHVAPGGQGWDGSVLLRIAVGPSPEDADAWYAMKQIHRRALARLLGPRPLKSRELFLAGR